MTLSPLLSSLVAAAISAVAVAQTSSGNIHDILWPTRDPSATRLATDPYYCSTRDLSRYFSPPEPTGALESAIYSFNTQLYKACTFLGPERLKCPFPEHSRWCAFGQPTSVSNQPAPVPTSILPLYSSYASLASSWWAASSASALELARDCPNLWADASVLGAPLLNRTIAIAHCYAEAVKTNGGVAPPMTTGASPGSMPTAAGPSPTNAAVMGRRAASDHAMWGGVAAAAAANAAW